MARIQLKRLTSTDIDQATVVLAAGEPCLAKDTDNKEYIVFGDGSTQLKDLKREPIGDAASVAIDQVTIVEDATTKEIEVQLSADTGNAMSVKTDGLFVETVDQVKVSTKNLLPTTGKEKTLYVVSDEKHIYYWDGTAYVQLTQDFAGLIYKGSKNTTADLPTSGMKNGDFWWVVSEDKFKIWNGTTWDTIELAQDQADMAETTTTSTTFIKNKKAEYITYVQQTTGSVLPTNTNTVQKAITELDKLAAKKQDKVTTAKQNNYASWDNAGQTKDSGDSKTTTVAPLDAASDNKLPSEKAVAKVKKDLEDAINNQPTSNPADDGDVAICQLVSGATGWYNLRAVSTTEGTFSDELMGGYVFTGCQNQYLNKTFNRLKLFIATPGWVRIGIVRGTGLNTNDGVARGFCRANKAYNAKDTYPTALVDGKPDTTADGTQHTTLKKWLLVQWVATPGLHEWDIADEIITSPLEYLYIECRMGVSGWAMNLNSTAATVSGITVPANTKINGLSWPNTYQSATNFNNGKFAVSNNMLDASARPTYSVGQGMGGVLYNSWNDCDSANTAEANIANGTSTSWLNLGVYRRGDAGNTYLDPIVENCTLQSFNPTLTTSCICGYGPKYENQQKLVGTDLEIYGVEFVAMKPGDLTFYVFSSNDPATAKIVKTYTLRVRAIGRQLVKLPEPVTLLEGQWCGVAGATEALVKGKPDATVITSTTLPKGYVDDATFTHDTLPINNWTQFGDDPTGVKDLVPYSSAINEKSFKGFDYWSGVTYTPSTGKIDFTGATLQRNTTYYLNISLVCRKKARSKLENMFYSVTGDSISTYRGSVSTSTDFDSVKNAAGNNAIFYPDAGVGLTVGPDTTWWGALGKKCRMRLIRNDAWSGSKVTGTDSTTNSTACASAIRCRMLSGNYVPYAANTTTGLGVPYGIPDVIFCMIGTNDLSGNVTAGAYSNTAPADLSTILGAFETMVARHKGNYPNAKRVYFIIPRGNSNPYPFVNANGLSIAQLSSEFEYVATALGAYFVPLNYFNDLMSNAPGTNTVWTMTAGYTTPRTNTAVGTSVDYLHPNAIGHQMIADALARFCEEKF